MRCEGVIKFQFRKITLFNINCASGKIRGKNKIIKFQFRKITLFNINCESGKIRGKNKIIKCTKKKDNFSVIIGIISKHYNISNYPSIYE